MKSIYQSVRQWTAIPFLMILLVIPAAQIARGQSTGNAVPAIRLSLPGSELTVETVLAQAQQSIENPTLDEAAKAQLERLYGQAADHLKLADQWASQAAEFEKTRQAAPEMLQKIRGDLDAAPPCPRRSSRTYDRAS